MSKRVYASMDSKGYISDGKTLMDELFAAWLLARRSQSEVFFRNVPNADETMMLNKDSPDSLAEQVKLDLETLFGAHFDTVTVRTSSEAVNYNMYRLRLAMECILGETRFDLTEVIHYQDGKVVKFMETTQ